MKIIKNIAEMKHWALSCQSKGESISFVPTMGNLHEGHLSLVDIAKHVADNVVVSIFVNPTQFAAHEDLAVYPRTEKSDCTMLDSRGVDVVFMPEANEIYPENETIEYLEVPDYSTRYEGEARPTHFRGVAIVLKKLFDCVLPQHAVFGEKDFQQVLVVNDMVRQQGLNIKIHGGAIVRDDDGVAKSSRNQYLTTEQRSKASVLNQALHQAKQLIIEGKLSVEEVERQSIDFMTQSGLKVDYFAIRDASDLSQPQGSNRVILTAARFGETRLLDNLRID